MALRGQGSLSALTEDVLKISEIEGAQLNAQSARSSIARHLGVDIGALAPVDRTNLRDISDLSARGVLLKTEGVWHNTGYVLKAQIQ